MTCRRYPRDTVARARTVVSPTGTGAQRDNTNRKPLLLFRFDPSLLLLRFEQRRLSSLLLFQDAPRHAPPTHRTSIPSTRNLVLGNQ